MTVNEDGFDVFLSGRKLFEATDSTFKQGRIGFGNIDDSSIEVFDIVLLGGLEKVEVVNHSYTVYLVLFLSLILLRLSAMLHKKRSKDMLRSPNLGSLIISMVFCLQFLRVCCTLQPSLRGLGHRSL